MNTNTLPLSYWILGAQFLQLAKESCVEIIKLGNPHFILSATEMSESTYHQEVRWTDHKVGVGVLFSFYHGIELMLKGFLVAIDMRPTHHFLTQLLREFEAKYPSTDLGNYVNAALPLPTTDSSMGRFLLNNSIDIDKWYEALKYPETKSGQPISHFKLKYGGANALPFWRDLQASSIAIQSAAVALSRHHGYA